QRHVPAIVSRNAGVTEVVRSVVTIDPGDAEALARRIVYLLDSPVTRWLLARHAAEEVRGLSWRRAAGHCLDVYRELCWAGAVSPPARTAPRPRRATRRHARRGPPREAASTGSPPGSRWCRGGSARSAPRRAPRRWLARSRRPKSLRRRPRARPRRSVRDPPFGARGAAGRSPPAPRRKAGLRRTPRPSGPCASARAEALRRRSPSRPGRCATRVPASKSEARR